MSTHIVSLLAKRYGITQPLQSHMLDGGEENQNFKIKTSLETYVLRFYGAEHSFKGARTSEQLNVEFLFMEQARNDGIPVPQIIKLINGTPFGFDEENSCYFALFVFEENGDERETFMSKTVSSLAECVEKLYVTSEKLSPALLKKTSLEFSIISRGKNVYKQLEKTGALLPTAITNLYESCMSRTSEAEQLTIGIIHGDIKLQNMLFDDDRLVMLLDFDDCRTSYILEDIALALMHNVTDKNRCLVRSGYAQEFIFQFKDAHLKEEIQNGLGILLRWRLVYVLAKLLLNKEQATIDEIMNDQRMADILEGKEFLVS